MRYEAVLADPAGNITLMVLSPVRDRPGLVRAAMSAPVQGRPVEQVGFVIPPRGDEPPRLEMMGGEFCGNAARSFGLFIAREQGLEGRGEVKIGISGMGEPLTVRFDRDADTASVEIPPPPPRREIGFRGRSLSVYDFQGISQVIVPETGPGEETFHEIRGVFEEDTLRRGLPLPGALGVMFWVMERAIPVVYVYGAGSLVFESSCGSGSAALGLYRGESLRDGREVYPISQPGGTIEAALEKRDGRVTGLSIGGPVKLGASFFMEGII